MQIISATFKNYCQHKFLEAKFTQGLNAVLGKNGSGKSNLVKGIYAALSGDFSRNPGVKLDDISQLAPPSAPSSVNVVATHGDLQLNVTRGLRPQTNDLKVLTAEGKTINVLKTEAINLEICNLLSVSKQLLSDYVFVDQWAIFDFLSMQPAGRAKAFQRLFKTEHAETIYKVINEHRDNIKLPNPGIDKDKLLSRLDANRVYHSVLSSQFDALSKKDLLVNIDAVKADLYKYTLKKELTAKLESQTKEIQIIYDEVNRLKKDIVTAQNVADKLSEGLTAREAKYLSDIETLGSWQSYDRVVEERNRLQERTATLTKSFLSLAQLVKPDDYLLAHEIDALLLKCQPKMARLSTLGNFAILLINGECYCPTCGTESAKLKIFKEDYAKEAQELSKELELVNERIAASRKFDAATNIREVQSLSLETQLQDVSIQLNRLKEINPPANDKSVLQRRIDAYRQLKLEFDNSYKNLEALSLNYQNKLGKLDQFTVTRNELCQQVEDLDNINIDFSALIAKLNLLKKEYDVYLRVTAELKLLNEYVAADEQLLQEICAVENVTNVERDWLLYTDSLRNTFHRDNLPKLAAQNYLELMEDEINKLLIDFESPFKVTTSDDLSFVANFKDGRKTPAVRLSGGEKVILAIAFRVVINDLFAKDLGLLCLDEPTAGLDDANIGCLKTAIQRLRDLSKSRGLQVILVTHEKELTNFFDHVIEL